MCTKKPVFQTPITPLSSFQNPAKIRTDILMSIKAEHIHNISLGTKNHEYRKYLLPSSVKRIWFYTSAPVSAIQYVAAIGRGREPGQVSEDGGIGNADFNAGKKVSKYGYPIKKLSKLRQPISIQYAVQKRYLKAPPQKYCWASKQLLDDYPLKEMVRVIGSKRKILGKRHREQMEHQDSPVSEDAGVSDFPVTADSSVKDSPVSEETAKKDAKDSPFSEDVCLNYFSVSEDVVLNDSTATEETEKTDAKDSPLSEDVGFNDSPVSEKTAKVDVRDSPVSEDAGLTDSPVSEERSERA